MTRSSSGFSAHDSVVSVVIPTRNRRHLLLRTLHSVLRQRDVALFVVVVDDAGTDGSAEAVHRLNDPRVRVVRHRTRAGVSAARNTGIEQVDTTWVAFVDDDDLWAPDKLRTQLDALGGHPGAQWACTGAAHIDEGCRVLYAAHPPCGPDIADLLLASNIVPGGGSGVVASTGLARQIGGFDVTLSNLADWDFYIRLGLRAPVVAVPGPLLGYYVHPGGMAHDIRRSEHDLVRIDAKYADERQARSIRLDTAQWLTYLAGLAYNGGHRWGGTRLHLRAACHGRLRSLRSITAGFLPDHVRVARARRILDQVSIDWLQEARAWLATYADDGAWQDSATVPSDV